MEEGRSTIGNCQCSYTINGDRPCSVYYKKQKDYGCFHIRIEVIRTLKGSKHSHARYGIALSLRRDLLPCMGKSRLFTKELFIVS